MKKYQTIYADPPPEIIRAYITQQTCWICGKDGWKALSQHLVKKHGLPANEVRELAYMFKCERLISEELSESISKDALRRFGEQQHIPLKGMPGPKHILSTKARDIVKKRIDEIRPLAGIAQRKRRIPHLCPICGKVVETSRPEYCSPKCASIALGEANKKHMTPERIAFFRTVRYKATPEELSLRAKRMWGKIRTWPIEKQKEYFLRRAESREASLINVSCVICDKEFAIPSYRLHGHGRKTCSKECSKHLMGKWSRERPVKDSTRVRLSELAKMRHIGEPQFGRKIIEVESDIELR